jgi:hypothetical protein
MSELRLGEGATDIACLNCGTRRVVAGLSADEIGLCGSCGYVSWALAAEVARLRGLRSSEKLTAAEYALRVSAVLQGDPWSRPGERASNGGGVFRIFASDQRRVVGDDFETREEAEKLLAEVIEADPAAEANFRVLAWGRGGFPERSSAIPSRKAR